MKRKGKLGGRRAGAGRPVSTGSDGARPISFRLGSELRARLTARGEAAGVSADVAAKEIVVAELGKR